jgi:hypothetical protein
MLDIKYIIDKYSSHESFYKYNNKPLFYIYDSYLISENEWKEIFKENGKYSIRNTKYDSFIISLYLKKNQNEFIINSGFNGIYTYFASTGFTEGSTLENWQEIKNWCDKNNLLFIPSVGPGYIDTRIRPWNEINTKDRENVKI